MQFARSLFFVTALAFPAFSDYIRIEPPAPTSSQSIVAEVGGVWGDGCIPSDPTVSRQGNSITVTLKVPERVACTQSPRPWKEEVTIGTLPPGVYTLRLEVAWNHPVPYPAVSLSFPVTDADAAFTLTPTGGPVAGGTEVFVAGSFGACPIVPPCHAPQVLFGGIPATSVSEVQGGVIARTPPHPPGAVDVEIRGLAGTSLAVLPAAFIYHGAGVPDRAAFTPLLIPLIVRGPGAFGSEWDTRATAFNDSDRVVAPLNNVITNCPPNVSPCPPPLFQPNVWDSFHYGLFPSGVLVWVPRTQSEDLHFAIKVHDRSRSVDNDGTNIPVVREDELLDEIQLLDIPLRAGFRHTLRVYDVGFTQARQVHVYAYGPAGDFLGGLPLTLRAADEACLGGPLGCTPNLPRFASVSDFVPAGHAGAQRMRLEIRPTDPGMRLWAFVSVTNNVTQQITTVTPE